MMPTPQHKYKCDRCFEPLSNHRNQQEAHGLVCLEINDVTYSSADEEGDDMFIDASVCSEEEGVTTVEQENVHAIKMFLGSLLISRAEVVMLYYLLE